MQSSLRSGPPLQGLSECVPVCKSLAQETRHPIPSGNPAAKTTRINGLGALCFFMLSGWDCLCNLAATLETLLRTILDSFTDPVWIISRKIQRVTHPILTEVKY